MRIYTGEKFFKIKPATEIQEQCNQFPLVHTKNFAMNMISTTKWLADWQLVRQATYYPTDSRIVSDRLSVRGGLDYATDRNNYSLLIYRAEKRILQQTLVV